jgi:hypothetical protein
MSQRVSAGPPVSMQAWITVVDWPGAATLALMAVERKTAVPAAASKRNIIVPPFERSLPDFSRLSAGRYPTRDYCVSWPVTPHVSVSR